ncbi:MAG: hypothetical protein ACI9IA_002278 [Enterobacterales bacterium]|jgi:hypothetical protein
MAKLTSATSTKSLNMASAIGNRALLNGEEQ